MIGRGNAGNIVLLLQLLLYDNVESYDIFKGTRR